MSNKFPQLEWINDDGRLIPVPKVQHYKKGSTTETELTGHDNPFPTTDKAVLEELEQVKAELEAIKNGTLNVNQAGLTDKIDELLAKQNEILERLNEPVDTRLTGSIDELDVVVRGTSLTKKFVNLDKRNLNIEPGQTVVISYYADNGEIWRPSHAYIEIAPPVDSIDEHGRSIILNPFNSYRSIHLGPSASTSEKSYVPIRTKGDEEVANWFQTLVMTDSSGFSARITNNSDGIVNTVLGGMVVEVISDENR